MLQVDRERRFVGFEIALNNAAILRVALYEMMYMDKIPSSVSINEAVELAKRFGGDRSSAYINGMLGTFARQIDKE